MRTVVFDLDGTLADTSGDLVAAANAVFGALGHGAPLTSADHAFTAFNFGGRGLLKAGFAAIDIPADDPQIELHFPKLLEAYEADIAQHTRVFDAVPEVLEGLRSKGYRLSICTNKLEYLAQKLLVEIGLRPMFDALIGADTLPTRKPDPAPYRAAVAQAGGSVGLSVLIGDTATDRNTAKAAGAPCVLVTFGPDGRAVEDLQPEATLDHYNDLPGIVHRLIG